MPKENYIISVGGMTCQSCSSRVHQSLSVIPGVIDVRVELEEKRVVISVDENGPCMEVLSEAIIDAGYTPNESSCSPEPGQAVCQARGSQFSWRDGATWRQSAQNTKWCLIGCSIGDLGTIAYFQFFWIDSGWSTMAIMMLAIMNGLLTSIALETLILLKQLPFLSALRTAAGMSLISMIAMEAAMNVTDVVLTGGAMLTWYAIIPMWIAGFLTPWPYNYWRLKKYGVSCH